MPIFNFTQYFVNNLGTNKRIFKIQTANENYKQNSQLENYFSKISSGLIGTIQTGPRKSGFREKKLINKWKDFQNSYNICSLKTAITSNKLWF